MKKILFFLFLLFPLICYPTADVTVCPGFEVCDYENLEAALDANEADITGDADPFVITISGDWTAAPDTTAASVNGNYVTDPDDYIEIITTGDARHDGKRYASKASAYAIEVGNAQPLTIDEAYVRIDGLQFKNVPTSTWKEIIIPQNDDGDASSDIRILNCILTADVSHASATLTRGITNQNGSKDCKVTIANCLIYGLTKTGSNKGIAPYGAGDSTWLVYNNTIYDCDEGMDLDLWTAQNDAYNNLCYDNGTDFVGTYDNSDYNFSKDDTAPEDGSTSIHGDTDGKTPDFVSTTGGSEDFHLQITSDAIDVGDDNPSSGIYLDDIDFRTRGTGWDIGADQSLCVRRTVSPSGADYTDLETALDALERDLTDTDQYLEIEINGDWSSDTDTTAVSINNYTTSETQYINIYTDSEARHLGVWSTDYYILSKTSYYGDAISVDENNVFITGLQIHIDGNGGSGYYADGMEINEHTNVNVDKCIFEGGEHSNEVGVRMGQSGSSARISNCIVYDFGTGITVGTSYPAAAMYVVAYNNTVDNVVNGFSSGHGSNNYMWLKNNISQNASGTDYTLGNSANKTLATNVDEDGSGDITGTVTFAGASDYHLAVGDSVARGAGTDLSTDGDGKYSFEDDIDGDETRSAWDCGADEFSGEESPARRIFTVM